MFTPNCKECYSGCCINQLYKNVPDADLLIFEKRNQMVDHGVLPDLATLLNKAAASGLTNAVFQHALIVSLNMQRFGLIRGTCGNLGVLPPEMAGSGMYAGCLEHGQHPQVCRNFQEGPENSDCYSNFLRTSVIELL